MNPPKYSLGDKVRVLSIFPPGHVRTPYFVRGHEGTIVQFCGHFANPEELAYGRSGEPKLCLYRIEFNQQNLWQQYSGSQADKLMVDIFEHWIELKN